MHARTFFWSLLVLFFIVGLISATHGIATPVRATQSSAHTASNSAFVTSRNGRLYLNGAPYIFHGTNIFNATNINNCWYFLGKGSSLDANLNAIGNGQNAFRGWFFQYEATINGQRDWSGIDHALAVAKAHGQHVIAVLTNQWDDCEKPPRQTGYKPEPWYKSGYRTVIAPGTLQTYRNWVASVVARYKNDPTILAWQLMNEAEDRLYKNGPCSSTATTTLYNWASDMSTLVKSIDPNHLLSLGSVGSGQCGAYSMDYMELHALPHIDVCEYHDYSAPNDFMPGDQWNGLLARIIECNKLGKPLFVGENGIAGADVHGNLKLRAADFAAKFAAQFGAGVVGELVWDWRAKDWGGSSHLSYEVGPGDPTLAVIGRKYISPSPSVLSAQVLNAIPAIGSTVTQAQTTVTVECNENINPDPSLSNLFVYGPSGDLISQGDAIVSSSNPKEMSSNIKPDGNGVYIVQWNTVSTDNGNPDQGAFTFTVKSGGAAIPTSTAVTHNKNINITITGGSNKTSGREKTVTGDLSKPALWTPILVGTLTLLFALSAGLRIRRGAKIKRDKISRSKSDLLASSSITSQEIEIQAEQKSQEQKEPVLIN